MSDSARLSASDAGWQEPTLGPSGAWGWLLAGLLCSLGLLWLQVVPRIQGPHDVTVLPHATILQPNQAVAATAPVLADVSCRAVTGDTVPATTNTCSPPMVWRGQFQYTGQYLWFNLVRDNQPGYLAVQVAGQPASELNQHLVYHLAEGETASYLPLFSPYEHNNMRPEQEWILVHTAVGQGPHQVTYEIGGDPVIKQGDLIQAVGVDLPFTPGWPRSPGFLLLLGGILSLTVQWLTLDPWPRAIRFLVNTGAVIRDSWDRYAPNTLLIQSAWSLGSLVLVGVGTREHLWWLSLSGLLGLGLLGLKRPAWWLGALLFGLPFYLHPVPLLPNFALNLIEIGVWGGAILALLHAWHKPPVHLLERRLRYIGLLLGGFMIVALFSAVDAAFPTQAFREWRTVFLTGFVFLLVLASILQHSPQRHQDITLLIIMWLAGAGAIALFGYYTYFLDSSYVTAVDGVRRIRGLYGSPNNLALYLERTALVTLALFVLSASRRRRLLWGLLLAVQGGALLLTFSKGALLLGVPAGILVLLVVTMRQAHQWPEAPRVLWLLAGAALLGIALLAPFLNTPRFASLLDVQQSFPNLVRLQLWRSGLHIFLDHGLLGAGPDNFLYLYRGFYIAPTVWNEPSLNHPHNLVIDLLSRLGFLGLLNGLMFLGVGLRQLYACVTDRQPRKSALGFLAAAVAGIVHSQVDASYALPDIMLVWVLLFSLWNFLELRQGPDPLLN